MARLSCSTLFFHSFCRFPSRRRYIFVWKVFPDASPIFNSSNHHYSMFGALKPTYTHTHKAMMQWFQSRQGRSSKWLHVSNLDQLPLLRYKEAKPITLSPAHWFQLFIEKSFSPSLTLSRSLWLFLPSIFCRSNETATFSTWRCGCERCERECVGAHAATLQNGGII